MPQFRAKQELNAGQRAVISRLSGATLVVAGAGTGKTRVLAARTVALLEAGADPSRLLLLTFTRRAAEEMKRRVAEMSDGTARLPWCGTFHGMAARLLRFYGRRIDIRPDFTILDEADSRDLLAAILARQVPNKDERRHLPAKAMLYRIQSYAVNRQCETAEATASLTGDKYLGVIAQVEAVYGEYAARKSAANALDYDDLLVQWRELLRTPLNPCRDLFDHVLVDEYQDTNILQADILVELSRDHGNVMVVGDDAQAIYSFRGATVDNILEFAGRFPETVRLSLEHNYRSTQSILDAANALIGEAAAGFDKTLFTHREGGESPEIWCCHTPYDEARRIADTVIESLRNGTAPISEQAILFRSAFQSFPLELELQKRHIPFQKFGGPRFAESAHIKDVLAFLRCRQNRLDETAWRRVLKLLPGIGDATASRLYVQLADAPNPVQALAEARWPRRATDVLPGFLSTIKELFETDDDCSPGIEIEIVRPFYEPLLADLYPLPEQRLAAIRELCLAAQRYPDRRTFLDEVLVGDNTVFSARNRDAEDSLTLSTVHSAKGREWDAVYVLGLTEGGLPAAPAIRDHDKIEEERRLLYVAMTRARNRLVMTYPELRETMTRDGPSSEPCAPSRFLSDAVRSYCRDDRGFLASELVYVEEEFP